MGQRRKWRWSVCIRTRVEFWHQRSVYGTDALVPVREQMAQELTSLRSQLRQSLQQQQALADFWSLEKQRFEAMELHLIELKGQQQQQHTQQHHHHHVAHKNGDGQQVAGGQSGSTPRTAFLPQGAVSQTTEAAHRLQTSGGSSQQSPGNDPLQATPVVRKSSTHVFSYVPSNPRAPGGGRSPQHAGDAQLMGREWTT